MFYEKAEGYLGLKEDTPLFRRFIDNFNSNHYVSYKMSYTDNWCAAFVSYILGECKDIYLKKSVSVHELKNINKRYFIPLSDLGNFQKDDIVLIDWGRGTGHTGFIKENSFLTSDVQYISGNSANSVRVTTFNIKREKVMGVLRIPRSKPHVRVKVNTYIRDKNNLSKVIGIVKKDTVGMWVSKGIIDGKERGVLLTIPQNQKLDILFEKGYIVRSKITMEDI